MKKPILCKIFGHKLGWEIFEKRPCKRNGCDRIEPAKEFPPPPRMPPKRKICEDVFRGKEMKKHYSRPLGYTKSLCSGKGGAGVTTQNYRECSCHSCITRMSPGEKAWHDKNNQEWIDYKLRDERRKHE